jgi:hypothetical protein
MKLNLFITVIFILIFSLDICPQNSVILRLKGNYNFFSMSDETALQNDLLSEVNTQGIPAEAVESFPPYYGLEFQLLFIAKSDPGKEYHVGLFFDQSSTGGRIDYKDYSGEIKVDQLFKAFSIGPIGEITKDVGNNFNLAVALKIPLIFGSFKIKSESRLGTMTNSQEIDFSAFTVGLEPGISLSYLFHKVSIGINMDWLIAFPSSYTLDSNSDLKLLNQSGDPVSIGMNGARFGLALGYRL